VSDIDTWCRYEVDASEVQEMAQKLAGPRVDAIANDELRMAISRGCNKIQATTQINTPVGISGDLRRSWGSVVTVMGPWHVEGRIGSTCEYAPYQEFGTAPHFPPPQALELWVQRKLGVSAKEAPGVAYLVARKISRTGTKGRFMLKKGFEKEKAAVRGFLQLALANIARRVLG
jgi:hypothetical protein